MTQKNERKQKRRPAKMRSAPCHSLCKASLFLLFFGVASILLSMLAAYFLCDLLLLSIYISDFLEAFFLSLLLTVGGALLFDLEVLRSKWK